MYDPNTFIQVAADCPVAYGVVPESSREPKPIHVLQFELLFHQPYRYTYAELLCEVYRRHKGMSEADFTDDVRQAYLGKSHPCLRASLLPKKYGWGVHSDEKGKLAIWGRESEEYRQFSGGEAETLKLTVALRNKRV